MGKRLYDSNVRLRDDSNEWENVLIDLGFSTLLPSIFQSKPLADVGTLQCGTFIIRYACARYWIDAGLQVEAITGPSFGELTAMVVLGVLSL